MKAVILYGVPTIPFLLVDLNYIEDSAGGPDLPVAILPKSGKVVMCQMDAKLPLDMFEKVLMLAIEGCDMLYGVMKEAVRQHTKELCEARGTFVT